MANVVERKRKMSSLEEDKQGLIELIEWYRDEYHKSDFCHTEMIEKIKQIQDEKELSIYEQVVDGWLD
jgi:hypothetical protein